jgi:S-adenosyl-L-methionine hydrolase (adenosine-forming)
MSIVTLLTDFGLKDGNVGVMKGVILRIEPEAQIIDLSHLIPPQNVAEAGLILARSIPFFPPGSIHVVVVDPGVGTARRPFAARIGSQFVVGPDNGFITQILERAEARNEIIEFVQLDRPEYWLPEVSHVFHGRDIFAPAAAHLASGASLHDLGKPLNDPVRLEPPHLLKTTRGWQGEVIHIDHFGNLSTNIRQEHLGLPSRATVRICGVEIKDMVRTFGERSPGELVALYGSTGNLLVCVVNGSAAQRLGAKIGDSCEVMVENNE